MKYKVGDRVLIKSLDWYNENKDKDGIVELSTHLFTPGMSQFCGKVMTISDVFEDIDDNGVYYMEEIDYDWTDEMIEGLVEEETKPKFNVGDRVITNKGYIGKFEGWVSDYQVRVLFPESGCNVVIHPKDLKLVEDEPNIDLAVKGEEVKECIEIRIPEGYEYVIESGKIIFTKKIKEYPKTYEECCKILGIENSAYLTTDEEGYWNDYELGLNYLIEHFRKLIICRDAYWKIAGEEMGLGKPWKPTDSDYITGRYCIFVHRGNIICDTPAQDCILTFPTEEMRDAFYENFKELINECKELL